ncbi:hypothetical protein OPIT5_07950 [Opitutaceae bacterium TAV5]|nr:hypothetical protein OPIT5_07950 [Opitutaceae bacterium TAV5]
MQKHRGSGSRVILLLLLLCILGFVLFNQYREAKKTDGTSSPPSATPTATATATTPVEAATPAAITRSPGLLLRHYLNAGDYDALEELYTRLAAGPFRIEDRWPGIMVYFEGVEVRRNNPEAEWTRHRQAIEAWCAARPQSVAARLALAEYYNNYAWKARGTDYASEVSAGQWKLFHERRDKALAILRGTDNDAGENSGAVKTSFYGRYLAARILGPDGSTFPEARRILDTLAAEEPGFYPACSLVAHYLLPRWHGRRGDLTRYAETAAARVDKAFADGRSGDILYACLLATASNTDDENFVPYHSPDYKRIVRGFEALLAGASGDRIENLSRFCQVAGRMEDWPRVRQLLGEIGPPFRFPEIGGRAFYGEMLRKSGLRAELDAIDQLELQGRSGEALERYESLGGAGGANRWLTRYYLSHGDADNYAVCDGAVNLALSFREIPTFVTLAEQCHVSLALRDLQRAHDIADRFDRYRTTTPVARIALYEIALHRGETEAVARTRRALLDLQLPKSKTWSIARDLLSGKRNPADILAGGFDWLGESDAPDTAAACALRCYELGETEAARNILITALAAGTATLNEDARMRALLLRPPGA